MNWIDKTVDFLAAAVGPDLHRYLLIVFLTSVGFMGYGVVSMSVRSVTDRVCQWAKVDAQGRTARTATLALAVGITGAVLWLVYTLAPRLSPLRYLRLGR